jgi:hypothetical protein
MKIQNCLGRTEREDKVDCRFAIKQKRKRDKVASAT